ncbi:MAG: hypothetical protein H7A24_15295 [Leptospiraceae bacterium]|nr:hypothetical protein [Leptospiraceae bacterium]MCP5513251.1 hypothetical protein [Leptospiraceae bacterium]
MFLLSKKLFLFIIIVLFTFIKSIDNEYICGEIGGEEVHCFFSNDQETDSDHSEHVCYFCPCNNLSLFYPVLKFTIEIQIVFYDRILPIRFRSIDGLFKFSIFRPPENSYLV